MAPTLVPDVTHSTKSAVLSGLSYLSYLQYLDRTRLVTPGVMPATGLAPDVDPAVSDDNHRLIWRVIEA
jgi:hypothetical protein